ncbi:MULTISPECIES: DUF2721 domain-containing protein [unclassified Hahella]|uniref:DUF2721 domain-containing protein n=1 Tax=unclassified Hahella TaxID=2624107 RepID=UPI001C1E9794|nr:MULTISPECIES: DUF2721 domain-containing protein [unclassified Hahella]MBU6951427.1 DUF2721 domain-containing protein [Hahella sp. HN01]MDG9669000.1 DUF2721 domain-containing protein [Hahella sp. CR1]
MLNISTPALLFPAISLLLLAYTNRFLVIAQLIRSLYKQLNETKERHMKQQILHLRKRIHLIRWMQTLGVMAFILCTLSMGSLILQLEYVGEGLLGGSLLFLIGSLIICLVEIHISGAALSIQLNNLEDL